MHKAILLLSGVFAFQSFAVFGVGAHYGIDLTLNMDDTKPFKEQITFDSMPVKISNQTLNINSLPLMFVNRIDFQRTWLNLGGKIYIDVIPFIDAAELSCNFGVWQYKGSVQYIKSFKDTNSILSADLKDPNTFNYETVDLTLEEQGLSYLGLKETPYAKFHLEASVRKNILKFPPAVNIIKIYAGGGMNTHFATPMLSNDLLNDVVSKKLKTLPSSTDLQTILNDQNLWKDVVEEIISGLKEPTIGAHILAGFQLKFPVVPIGIYADGKYIIPFGKLDPNVDIGGRGLLINAGISFGL